MLSLSGIRQLSRDAAIRSVRDNRIPFTVEPEDLIDWKRRLETGTLKLPFPSLGAYVPNGFRRTTRDPLFVDHSGCGTESEPALTVRALVEALTPGKAYAIIETGQFQLYVAEYERDDSSPGNEGEFIDLTSAEEKEFDCEFGEQPRADIEIRFEGTICLFEPHTRRGKTWIQSHVAPDAQCWGQSLVVEHRYAKEIAKAMKSAGLLLA
jgi:hypothetical protein